jgi:hypothetical protein
VNKNRHVPWYSDTVTGSSIIKFPQWAVRLVIVNGDKEMTFKIKNKDLKTETFSLHPGERFDEEVVPYKELEVIVDNSGSWWYMSHVDIDAKV